MNLPEKTQRAAQEIRQSLEAIEGYIEAIKGELDTPPSVVVPPDEWARGLMALLNMALPNMPAGTIWADLSRVAAHQMGCLADALHEDFPNVTPGSISEEAARRSKHLRDFRTAIMAQSQETH